MLAPIESILRTSYTVTRKLVWDLYARAKQMFGFDVTELWMFYADLKTLKCIVFIWMQMCLYHVIFGISILDLVGSFFFFLSPGEQVIIFFYPFLLSASLANECCANGVGGGLTPAHPLIVRRLHRCIGKNNWWFTGECHVYLCADVIAVSEGHRGI